MGRLDGKVAIITGGASGIGRASVHRFLAEGARVVIADLNPITGAQVLAEAEAAGLAASVRFVKVDVAEEADIEAMIAAAVEGFGRLDVLFNNAGIGGAFGPLTEIPVAEWDRTFAMLVRSVFLGCRHAVPAMRAAGGGSIINTASIAGVGGGGGPTAYSVAKAGVVQLTRMVALEFGADRIRCNAIAPGGVMTPLMHRGDTERAEARMIEVQPLPKVGQPDDIANLALFLASDESAFITGETIIADGGVVARGVNIFPPTGIPRSGKTIVSGFDPGTTSEKPTVRRLGESA